MIQKKQKLERKDKKLINKLQTRKIYKIISSFIYYIFSLRKNFITTKNKKALAIISVTTGIFFGRKVGYIDDFIVHTRARGKGLGKKMLSEAINNLEKENTQYIFLVSRKERKASHHLYKKFGFAIISLGIGILAYKKHKK